MSLHLIVSGSDESGSVALRDKQGSTIHVPAEWIPTDAREGSSVLIDISHQSESSVVTISLVKGTTEPEGTDIGA
jgi:hypothetical protein